MKPQISKITQVQNRMKQFEESFKGIPKTDPWVSVDLRGRQFKLELSFESAQKIQRQLGLSLFTGELTMDKLNDMEVLTTVLLVGIQTHHPEETMETIAPLIMLKHRVYYAHCISAAMQATQPDYSELVSVIGDAEDALNEEAGNTDLPLPEIESSPVFGQPAE